MKFEYTATELAYKNGFHDGYEKALETLCDYVENETFRKGYELKKVKQYILELVAKNVMKR